MDELLARVPKELQPRFREITELTDKFCASTSTRNTATSAAS